MTQTSSSGASTTSSRQPVLEARGLVKTFGHVVGLAGVDLDLYAGEVLAVIGDNGAGKSTLIKCIAGIHPSDGGAILFEGREVHIHGPKDAGKLGIEVVYQDLALCDNLDVVQNMYLGREINRLQVLAEAPKGQTTLAAAKRLDQKVMENAGYLTYVFAKTLYTATRR